MITLMPASEAKKIIANMADEKSQRLQQQAKDRIEAAVSQGVSKVSLTIDYSHKNRIEEWLASLGYKVNSGSDQREGDWFEVSW